MTVVVQAHSFPQNRSEPSPVPGEGSATVVKQIPELTSITSAVTVEAVARYFGGIKYTPDKKTVERIRQAIEYVTTLISAVGTYSLYPLSDRQQEKDLLLKNGIHLPAPACCITPDALFIATALGTLGEKLENKCRQLALEGKIYQSTLLDAAGTATLDLCGETISKIIEEDCHRRGLFKGYRFGPGLNGYPLKFQGLLFKLADHQSLNVSLNSSDIMTPAKSISFFLTLTQSRSTADKTDKCSSCRMEQCQYRLIP